MSIDNPAGRGNLAGMTLELRSLDALKAKATQDPKAAIKGAARQLETLFMQELMKSMRANTMSSGMLDNSGTKLGTEMLDTEYAARMSGLPGGLSAAIERQLGRQIGKAAPEAQTNAPSLTSLSLQALRSAVSNNQSIDPEGATSSTQAPGALGQLGLPTAPLFESLGSTLESVKATLNAAATSATDAATANAAAAANTAPANSRARHTETFVRRHLSAAQTIEAETGIPAANLIGQAAHESGWGKHEIKNKDGTPSHNLFGIKAGANWKGKVAEVTTTEYIGGVARRVTARFRSYDSYEEAFRDHAKLITNSPRYSNVVAQAGDAQSYAKSLQKAGYATDPEYAQKLTKVINTALRVQRTVT